MVKTNDFVLRYSNCWEDADVLCHQMSPVKGKKICSIASGGENSLSLLMLNPELLYIVDINPLQIYLAELKAKAIEYLEYEEVLAFKGFVDSTMREEIYIKLKSKLSHDTRAYWDTQPEKIKMGFIHSGETERKMRFFAKYIRPLFHSTQKVENLIAHKTEEKQSEFYKDHWDTLMWKGIFRIFFSRTVMSKMSPDPDFLNYFKGSISEYLYGRTSRHFSSASCQKNHILQYILLGSFGDVLPHYMQHSNFQVIKNNIGTIKYHVGFAEDPSKVAGAFDGYNLSNIFEYTLPHEFDTLVDKLHKGSRSETRFVYWNILMDRLISSSIPEHCINVLDTSVSPIDDKGWLYKRCVVDQII